MRAYSVDLRERVVAAVQGGRSVTEVAHLFGVSRRSISRYLRQAATMGELTPRRPPGHRRHIPVEQESQLRAQLQSHDSATLERHCDMWAATSGIRVSPTTMYRAIKRLGWTWKKKAVVAAERDEAARVAWRETMAQHDPAQFVFVDESSANTTLTPRYGRAPKGERAPGSAPRN